MMCHDALLENTRNLTGNYFAENFSYFQVDLNPCDSDKTDFCASDEEKEAYFARNSKL